MPRPLVLPFLLALAGPLPGQSVDATALTLADAIRAAWTHQPWLLAGQAQADQAHFEASAAAALRRPTLQAQIGWTRSDEPMQAFGLKLDQARIQAADFDPARLNRPDAVHGLGAAISLSQPLYAGGRLEAAQRGSLAQAGEQDALQSHRGQQTALAVVQAYFGVQAAGGAVAAAAESLKSAEGTETFVAARVAQGLLLRSEEARVKAWRAQAAAALAEAQHRHRSARSTLALLLGQEVPASLASALETFPEDRAIPVAGRRADLESARFHAKAAWESVKAARAALKPEVGLHLAWGTARETLSRGGATWTTASLGAKWSFSFSDSRRVQAAQAMARAADHQVRWHAAQADREREEAASATVAARQRVQASLEAVSAAEEALTLRRARHREGLLPLTDLLDAEVALQGARALRLAALLEFRTALAQADFAQGSPIEGVTP